MDESVTGITSAAGVVVEGEISEGGRGGAGGGEEEEGRGGDNKVFDGNVLDWNGDESF